MKILKTAEQSNFIIDTSYYTLKQINEMLCVHEVCYFDSDYKQTYKPLETWEVDETVVRIFADDINEIKVVYLKEYGHYKVVAIGKNGKTYYIDL